MLKLASSPRLLCNTPAKPLRCPCARDCNSYPTDSSATPLGRLVSRRPLQTTSTGFNGLRDYRGCFSTWHTPFRRRSVCSSSSPRAGHGGQVVVARGHGKAGYANYRHGADRCSMAGMGVGAGSLKILTGVLVHRVTRPLRGSVSCGSGWSVPCVSIQLTDPFGERARCVFHRQSFHFDTRGHRTGAHTDANSAPLEGPMYVS